MLKHFTAEQMLEIWMRHEGLSPTPGLLAIEDPSELRSILLDEIDAWYSAMLSEAPPSMLPTADVAAQTWVSPVTANEALVRTPDILVRPLRLKMKAWRYAVHDFPAIDPLAEQEERYAGTASTPECPRALLLPTGMIAAYGLCERPRQGEVYAPCAAGATTPSVGLDELTGVVRPVEGYTLDPQLIYRHFHP